MSAPSAGEVVQKSWHNSAVDVVSGALQTTVYSVGEAGRRQQHICAANAHSVSRPGSASSVISKCKCKECIAVGR